jgi:hypothetical protein
MTTVPWQTPATAKATRLILLLASLSVAALRLSWVILILRRDRDE